MHGLLKRQIKKSFGADFLIDERMKKFLDSVNQSYTHFDDSQELLQRTMEISNEELFESNKRLVEESVRHSLLVNSLKESIREISPGQKVIADDLLKIADELKSEIVKRKQVENELEKAREIAESSLKIRETFFANMSHEIRTPMNGIIGMSRLMSETKLNNEQKKFQRVIQSSAEDLLVVINDILDITKMSSGNFSLETTNFSLNQMLEDISKLLELKANEKGIYLKLKYDLGIAKASNSDPIRLKQILINLIGNAIKFTEKGGVILAVDLEKKKVNSDIVRFAISDTGVGIAPEKIKTIFNSFVQEDESTNRRFGGTGLGLTISKQLVERFNGELQVESIKGNGATFYFSIEIPHGEIKSESILLTAEVKDLKNISILLVEDNEINVFVATTVLSKWNCRIESAENGQIALDRLSVLKYDIILMDMQMPVLDGLEATRYIRETLKLNVPIIGFTANALQGEKENCLKAGMDDYVTKPFDPDELYRKIKLLGKL